MSRKLVGRVHSIQTMGTLDGPGVRFVVFMQGCNLRCKCCHNPDTWDIEGGTEYSAKQLVAKATRYREYFGAEGGVTATGGEPLLQAEFVAEFFGLCHEAGLHTCLDTSGSILSENVKLLLAETDRVLLDIKYTEDSLYHDNVGCPLAAPMEFLKYLNEQSIQTTLRQVIIPGINDGKENVLRIKAIADDCACVDKIELLPFRKLCQTKYDAMGLTFPFAHLPEPGREAMKSLQALIFEYQ
ncbi:MAG: pyruvate formate lyase-activating protein [Ruminococcaceae bacterium]|nr:pyruvate formate lyase-activating protein [Oscillospiraceae bacterium]